MSHQSRMKQLVVSNRCPIKRKPFDKLKLSEIEYVFNFISENKGLDDRTFKGKAHYLFLDGKDGRESCPHHIEIIEVLMATCKVG